MTHFNQEVGKESWCVNGLQVMHFHIFKKVVEEEGERLKNVVSGEDGQLFSTRYARTHIVFFFFF